MRNSPQADTGELSASVRYSVVPCMFSTWEAIRLDIATFFPHETPQEHTVKVIVSDCVKDSKSIQYDNI